MPKNKNEKFDKKIAPKTVKALEKGLLNLLTAWSPLAFLKGTMLESFLGKKITGIIKNFLNRSGLSIKRHQALKKFKKDLYKGAPKEKIEKSFNELIKIERRKL